MAVVRCKYFGAKDVQLQVIRGRNQWQATIAIGVPLQNVRLMHPTQPPNLDSKAYRQWLVFIYSKSITFISLFSVLIVTIH
jgi:hypothetical protein